MSATGRKPTITPQHSNTHFRRGRISRPPQPLSPTGSPQRIETRAQERRNGHRLAETLTELHAAHGCELQHSLAANSIQPILPSPNRPLRARSAGRGSTPRSPRPQDPSREVAYAAYTTGPAPITCTMIKQPIIEPLRFPRGVRLAAEADLPRRKDKSDELARISSANITTGFVSTTRADPGFSTYIEANVHADEVWSVFETLALRLLPDVSAPLVGWKDDEATLGPAIETLLSLGIPSVEKLQFIDECPRVTERLVGDPSSQEIISTIVGAFQSLPPR